MAKKGGGERRDEVIAAAYACQVWEIREGRQLIF